MNKTKVLLATIAISLAIFATVNVNSAFAQASTEEIHIEPWHYALAGASFIVSGVFYSSSGWIKKVRRKLAGQGDTLDYKKMGKSVLIGVILGVGAMIYSTYNGDTIVIINAEQFFAQVAINTTAILFVDKWILGRADPEEKAGPTGDAGEDDFDDLEEELPTEVPPGKDD